MSLVPPIWGKGMVASMQHHNTNLTADAAKNIVVPAISITFFGVLGKCWRANCTAKVFSIFVFLSFFFVAVWKERRTSLGGTKYCWLCCLFVCFTNARCLIEGEGKGKADPRILHFAMNYSSIAGCEWVYVCVRLAYFRVSCIIKHFCN